MIKQKKQNAISPIVAVIILVVIAVLLTSAVSQFALDLQTLLQEPVQAGTNIQTTYNADSETYNVELVWSSEGTVESLHIIEPNGAKSPKITDIGQSVTVTNIEEGESIRIIGTTSSGQQGVIQTYTV